MDPTAAQDTSAPVDLQALGTQLLEQAGSARAGRAARTLPHPTEELRQTVIALRSGEELSEHESPGPASLLVIRGRVRLVSGDDTVELGVHELNPVPNRRHSLQADDDSVVLLSVATGARP